MAIPTKEDEMQAQMNAWCGTANVDYISEERGLSNLFKYAVPKLKGWRAAIWETGKGCASYVDSNSKCRMWEQTMSIGETPTLALFWALWEIKEAK
jgi:hypothetical protein